MSRSAIGLLGLLIAMCATAAEPDEQTLRKEIEQAATQAKVSLATRQVDELLLGAGRQRKDVLAVYSSTSAADRVMTLSDYFGAKARYVGGPNIAETQASLGDFDWQYMATKWKGAIFLPLKNDGADLVELKGIESNGVRVNFLPSKQLAAGEALVTPVFDSTLGRKVTAYYSAAGMEPSRAVMLTGSSDVLSWSPSIYGRKNRVFIGVVSRPPGAQWYLNNRAEPIADSERAMVAPGPHTVRVVKDGHDDYCETNRNVAVDWVVNAVLVKKGSKGRNGNCLVMK